MNDLKQEFSQILEVRRVDQILQKSLWSEIETRYVEGHRKYHTLVHLSYFLQRLGDFRNEIADWEISVLALFYHDLVYDVQKQDNEELSAKIAEERLNFLRFDTGRIVKCKELILATKGHGESSDFDTNVFVDCDLSILGAGSDVYREYSRNIREEYKIYPEEVYIPGRKKVLEHFLAMDFIFKTIEFRKQKETKARKNLKLEWEVLHKGTLL